MRPFQICFYLQKVSFASSGIGDRFLCGSFEVTWWMNIHTIDHVLVCFFAHDIVRMRFSVCLVLLNMLLCSSDRRVRFCDHLIMLTCFSVLTLWCWYVFYYDLTMQIRFCDHLTMQISFQDHLIMDFFLSHNTDWYVSFFISYYWHASVLNSWYWYMSLLTSQYSYLGLSILLSWPLNTLIFRRPSHNTDTRQCSIHKLWVCFSQNTDMRLCWLHNTMVIA